MHRFTHRALGFALLAFLTVGCDGQEGEPLDPVLDEQVSPYPEGKTEFQALTAEEQAPAHEADPKQAPVDSAQEEPADGSPVPGLSNVSFPWGLGAGHVTWRAVGPRTAEFTVLSAFRRTYPGSGPDGLAVTGDLFETDAYDTRLCFGFVDDNWSCLYPLTYEVISYNAEEQWLLGRAVDTSPQPLPGTGVTVTETEPNGWFETPDTMNLGDDYVSHLSTLDDLDFVRFTLTGQTPIRIHAVSEELLTASVGLYSSEGYELASNHGGWAGGRAYDIQITLEAGTYYIRTWSGFSWNTSGGVTLELRELGPQPPRPITTTYSGLGPYLVRLEGCCTGNWQAHTIGTLVRFDLPNSSPVSTLQPLFDVPVNTPDFSFQIPATDAEGDELTFRLATRAESGLENLPSGLTISSSGLLSWDTTRAQVDQLWPVQVVIEERRDGQLIGSSAVSFLLRTLPPNNPPVCVLPAQTAYDVGLGEELVFSIGGIDEDPIGNPDPLPFTSVDINAVDLPDNAYASPYVPFWGPSGSSIDIHWTTPFIESWVGRTFTLNFTVTDWEGLTTPCSVDIHIVPPRLPVADAGPDLALSEGASVMLDGRGSSDPEGNSLSYNWQVLEPLTDPVLSSPSSPTPLFTPRDEGTYILQLGVRNSHGSWAYDTLTVTVENVAPVVLAEGAFIAPGTEFIAAGSIIDPGHDLWTASVDYGDGSGWHPLEGVDRTFVLSHFYADSGTYQVVITVTDEDGAVGETTVQVQVDERYMVPRVHLSPGGLADEGSSFTTSGRFTDLDNASWTASVDYGDGSGWQPLALDGQSFTLSHVYADDGYYWILVRVTDEGGAMGMAMVLVLIMNTPPEVTATANTVTEGSITVISGSITDLGMDSVEAWIDYGDGSEWEPVLVNSDKTFTLNHRYPYFGTAWASIYAVDSDGDWGYFDLPVVINSRQPVVEISTLGTAHEGEQWFGAGSFITGPNRGYFYSAATVDYGDGSGVESLWTSYNEFWLSHRYTHAGIYTVTVTIVAEDGITTGTATAQVVVHNVAPQLSLWTWPSWMEGVEGQEAGLWGRVIDAEQDTVTLTVDYGDGSAVEQIPVYQGWGDREFGLRHVYASSGTYTVTITATDDDGATSTLTVLANIWNVIPQVHVWDWSWPNAEGSAFTATGEIYDPGVEESFTAVADYGDGTGLQPVVINGNSFELSHVYADDGDYEWTVYVTDADGGMGMYSGDVSIYNVDPMVEVPWEGATDEGSTFTASGSISDPGPDTWTAMVNYGDGSDWQPLEITGNTFQLSHVYADAGHYWVSIEVFDSDGGWGWADISVEVRDVPAVINVEGGTIYEGSMFTSSGTLSDPGDEYWWLSINYGDGSDWETIEVTGNTFQLNHFYAVSGTYEVTIHVWPDDELITLTLPVVVIPRPPEVSLSGATIHEGEPLSLAGSFVSLGSSWTGTVDYGDGAGEQPLALDGTTFTLDHVYADNGSYTVTVRIQDGAGGVGSATAQVVVENAAPVVTVSHDAPQYWGLPVHFAGTVIDPGTADTAAGFSTSWALGDGTTASGLTTAHAYASPGSYVAMLAAADKDGGSSAASTAVQIQKRPSSLTCDDTLSVFGYPVALTAQLADALPGAQLGGKRLTFRVGTTTGSSTTDVTGLGSVQSPGSLAPGHYTVTVSFAEDSHYTGAQAECELTVTGSDGHITGGGLSFANKARGGFNVKLDDAGQPRGELQFKNSSTTFHAHTMTALGVATDSRSGWFSGTGEDGRHFTAYVEDNGEPGSNDVFKLWIEGVLQTGDGRLSGGNIQIHRETLAAAP